MIGIRGQYGIIDQSHKKIIKNQYDTIEYINDLKKFVALKDTTIHIYDAEGHLINDFKKSGVEQLFNQYVLIKHDQQYGLITIENKEILPIEYDKIKFISQAYVGIQKNETWKIKLLDNQ